MNFKKIILALIVVGILTSTTAIIFAESVTVGGISFDVPGNYSINKTADDCCVLKNNGSTISIVLMNSSNPQLERSSRMAANFTFLAEKNYTSSNGINVTQQDFMKNESYFAYYTFNVTNSSYLIIYSFPANDNMNNAKNPVIGIIESIQ